MQLEPREYFTIVRQLDDPQLTGTFYVRAYIRNSRTNVLIDTLDLEDQGNYRFTKEWQVPADSSGRGFYIDITSRVFTDSGYTTESDVFAREKEQHLIAKRYDPILLGHEGGVEIDYKKIKKIIQDEISKIKIPNDFSPILKAIKDIEVSPIVKTEQIDLKGLTALIQAIKTAIEVLPKPEKVDFTSILSEFKKLNDFLSNSNEINSLDLANKIKELKTLLLDKFNFVTIKMPKGAKNIKLPKISEKIKKDEKHWRKYY